MKKIILALAKRYAIKAVNDLLLKYGGNVQLITPVVDVWVDRLQKIILQLKRLNGRVSDGVVDDEEVEKSVAEIETLIREF